MQAGMFNDKSTAAERQAVLQGLLRRGAAAAGGSPHSAAQVNALLARSPAEAELFAAMDAAAPPPALLAEEEVPAWVTAAALSPSASPQHQVMDGQRGFVGSRSENDCCCARCVAAEDGWKPTLGASCYWTVVRDRWLPTSAVVKAAKVHRP